MRLARNAAKRPASSDEAGRDPESLELLILIARLGKLNDLIIADLLEEMPHPEVHGYGQAECFVLTHLLNGDPPYQASPMELCRVALQSPSGMTKTLARLERAGLIRRGQDASDRRSLPVALTPKGRMVAEGNAASSIRRYSRIVADLSTGKLRALNGSLRDALALLEQEVDRIRG